MSDLFSPPPLRPVGPGLPGQHREHAARDAYATMAAIQGSNLVERYRSLLAGVTAHGYRTKSGPVVYGLTDYEAAALLKVERSSINAARNALADAEPGAVTAAPEKRKCFYRPSKVLVNEWRYRAEPAAAQPQPRA